jgi:hypothetical protein
MTQDEARIEARAKIIWGESKESVSAFLQTHGFGEQDTLSLLAEFDQERATAIRSSGIKKLTMGALLVPIPVIAYLVFMAMGVILMKIFAITIVAGLFGLWKVIDGISMIMAPGSERGDLSSLSD